VACQSLIIRGLDGKTSAEIDTLKAFSIIGVLFIHMGFQKRFNPDVIEWIKAVQSFLGWSVLAFFFCSGLTVKKSKSRFDDTGRLILEKGKRLLLPCIYFSVLYKTTLIGIDILGVFHWQFGIPQTVYELFLFVFSPIAPQFYFLPYLFLITILTSFTYSFLKNSIWVLFLFILISILFYAFGNFLETPNGPTLKLIFLYGISFCLGFVLSGQNFKNNLILIGSGLLLAVFLVLLGVDKLLLYVLVAPLIYLLIRWLSISFRWFGLGEKSGAIYVWHAPVVMPFWSVILDKIVGNDYIELPLIIVCKIVSCLLLANLTRRYVMLRGLAF
jgi:hypothetical protein